MKNGRERWSMSINIYRDISRRSLTQCLHLFTDIYLYTHTLSLIQIHTHTHPHTHTQEPPRGRAQFGPHGARARGRDRRDIRAMGGGGLTLDQDQGVPCYLAIYCGERVCVCVYVCACVYMSVWLCHVYCTHT